MDTTTITEFLRNFGLVLAAILGISLLLGLLLLAIAVRQMRHIDVPPGATFGETLHYTPLLVVLGIDLLDFALDILAAPVTWVLLDRMGLKALRDVSAVEAVIPGTQPIPLLTAAWIFVRVTGYERPPRSKYQE
jgi:hypothetical protein